MTSLHQRLSRPALIAGLASLLLFSAGCGNDSPTTRSAEKSPSHSNGQESPSSTKSSTGESRTFTVPVYYLGDTEVGVRLFREFHKIENSSDGELLAALKQAVGDSASDPDYRTGFPAGTTVRSTTFEDGLATVDLSGKDLSSRPAGTSRAAAKQALNAVVFTVDGVTQSKASVAFEVDGKPVENLLGVRVGDKLGRANPNKVKSTISIFSPTQGAEVSSPFTVKGEAATFEANVVWELMKGDRVVKQGFTTAAECCTLAPYSFKVRARPGSYTLVVHDTDESDGEGFGTGADTKDITVR